MIHLSDRFQIDEKTHELKSLEFDREDPIFSGMIVPQIQLELILDCGSKIMRRKRFAEDFNHSLIFTDEILYSTDITYLNIIILDENDNSPVFTNPWLSESTIGYPEPSLVDQVIPPYLTVMEAHDKDEGLNAIIRYGINENIHFGIDAKSGVIYPLKDCFKGTSEVVLTVTATDRDGAADGNSNSNKITVIEIQRDYLVDLRVNDQDLNDFDNILNTLIKLSEINLRVINYAPVPAIDPLIRHQSVDVASGISRHSNLACNYRASYSAAGSLKMAGSNKTTIKMTLYAFNENLKLIPNKEITSKLENAESEYPMEMSEPGATCSYPEDNSYIPWMISTITLIVITLLVLTILGVLIFKLRDRIFERRNSDTQSQLENDFDKPPSDSSPVAKNFDNDHIFVIPKLSADNFKKSL